MSPTITERDVEVSPKPNEACGCADQLQRVRILEATVLVVRERGYTGASVTAVCARAKVSRHAFYEAFDGLRECFTAILDEGARRTGELMAQAFACERSWCEGVRGALAALLSFFDSEPALAYVLLVEASAAGPWARERRERHLAALTGLIEARWGAPADGYAHALVNSGVMASLLGVLHTHLVSERPEPLLTLLGPLMGLVTAPYLPRRLVAREIERGGALARELLADGECARARTDAERVEIPELLLDPRAHRARACLFYLTQHPGASNRQVARGVGIEGDTHISTLLARLSGVGLVSKVSPERPGGANAWSATDRGLRVSQILGPSRVEGKRLEGHREMGSVG